MTSEKTLKSGADPGFPIGGCQPSLEGAPASDTCKHM